MRYEIFGAKDTLVLIVVWLIQDFAQVMLMGICVVPDLFLLAALLIAAVNKNDNMARLIWTVFLGALAWDLRWTNTPGLSAALGSFITGIGYVVWKKIPAQGRSLWSFCVFSLVCSLVYGGAHFMLWTIPSQSAVRQFAMQQILSVPMIILCSWIYAIRSKDV